MKKVEGLEPAVRHKEAISDADGKLLEHYFDDVLVANDLVKLTMYVWFETTLHFGLRGREVQVQMTKKDLEFCNDETGEFIVLSKDFAGKNCQGGTAG